MAKVTYTKQFPKRIKERQLVGLAGIGLTRIGRRFWVGDIACLRYISSRRWDSCPELRSFRRLVDAKRELDSRGRDAMGDSLWVADAYR